MELYVEYLGNRPIKKRYDTDVGIDLYAYYRGDTKSEREYRFINPGQILPISAGIRIAMPLNYWAEVVPRSSTLSTWGIYVQPGVIDPGYTGEIFIIVQNIGRHMIIINKGERIAQLIVHPRVDMKIVECSSVEDKYKEMIGEHPPRGTKGFGSTGTS